MDKKRKNWRYADGSSQAKQVRIIESEFRKIVKAVQKMASVEKAKLKGKISMKLLQNLEVYFGHMGCCVVRLRKL